MTPEIHAVDVATNRSQWLALRTKDITSTDVAALFGLSPYLSPFELWHRKRSVETAAVEETERMRWGSRLEASIAQGAADEHGWTIEPFKSYVRLPDVRMGSSFDFRLTSPSPAILEVKNVDSGVYARNWVDTEDQVEAPPHIELQVQHQLEVAQMEEAYLVALVGGNTLKVVHRRRDREVGNAIRTKVAQFWASIDADTPPPPNYEQDATYIAKVLRRYANEGEVVQADIAVDQLLDRYRAASAAIAKAEEQRDAIKAEVLMRVGTASKVVGLAGTLSCGEVKDSPGKLITPDMVGTYYGARRGYRSFRFTSRKEK